jgi:hypothetical protein
VIVLLLFLWVLRFVSFSAFSNIYIFFFSEMEIRNILLVYSFRLIDIM